MSEIRPRVAQQFVVAALLLTAGCSSFTTPSNLTGPWGGEHIALVVTDTGSTVELDCASGTITEPLALDAVGKFDATGTFTPGHGGPIRQGETSDSHPARYTGQVKGSMMTLTIVETDSGTNIGTFTLQRGVAARVFRCL